MADQTQSSTVPAWQQAADSKLVRWLWRQLERPGLLQQQQAPQLLARYQGMVNGLPLATALHRRASIGADAQGTQGPIVYVTPPPWSLPTTLSPAAGTPTAQPNHQPLPVVIAAKPVVTEPLPSIATNPTAPRSPTPTAAQGGSPAVIQRKAMPGATTTPTPVVTAGTLPPTTIPPLAGSQLGVSRSRVDTGGLPLLPRRTSEGARTTVAQPRSTLNQTPPTPLASAPDLSLRPVVSAQLLPVDLSTPKDSSALVSPLPIAVQQLPTAPVATASPPLYPVVRVESPVRRPQSPPATNVTVQPTTRPTTPATPDRSLVTLVVREQVQPTQPINPALPVARPTEPLPLVTVAIPTPQLAVDHTRNLVSTAAMRMTGHERQPQAPLATRSAGQNPTSGAANPRQPAAEVQPAPPVDIDGLVDRVHRRFLQTLALEGERRGRR